MSPVNPEHLTVPAIGADNPPDSSGEWSLVIADTFGPEGSLAFWTRPNPLHLSSLPPGDPPPENRIAFDLVPPLDSVAACDREILVAEDPWNTGALVAVPRAVAKRDCAHIRAILDSKSVGELRRTPSAWRAAAENFDNNRCEDDPRAVSLSDDYPYQPHDWFGDEGIMIVLPLARLRTAECAPSCLDEFLREDDSVGMDYEPAPWLALEDYSKVADRLRSCGYLVVEDPALAQGYCAY